MKTKACFLTNNASKRAGKNASNRDDPSENEIGHKHKHKPIQTFPFYKTV